MPALSLNAVVGSKYRIEKRVGAGGMGEVYRAINVQNGTPVAVKVLTHRSESDTALARFRNEAVIQYNLRHPNVAELYEYFEYQGKPCIAMEFVEGQTLDEWIRETGGLEPGKALEILAEICDAVSYMHSKGTIHRDVKAENIRVNAQGHAKLLDFGISISKDTPAFTRTGYSIGTPAKMSPEQHQGLRGDARSDVWALGVLLYEMLTGATPFASSNPVGLREDIVAARYIPAGRRKPGLPKPVTRMISTCLQRKPDDRYSSSGVLLREVQQIRRGMAGEKWKRALFSKPALVATGLTALLVLILVYALRPIGETSSSGRQQSLESQPVSEAYPGTTPTDNKETPERPRARIAQDAGSIRPNRAPDASLPAPAGGEVNSTTGSNPLPEKTIRVATYDGPAEVANNDGQVLGSTPYSLTGPFGKSYELWLRRPGFQSRKVAVEINNKNEYLFGLEKIEDRPDFGKKE